MIIKINGEEIELQYLFRSNMYFEQIAGHKLNFENITAQDLSYLVYAVVYGTLQKLEKPVMTFLDFQNVRDDNGGDLFVYKFSQWYANEQKKQWDMINSFEEDKDSKKQSKKKR